MLNVDEIRQRAETLESYLREHIPISAAMGVGVAEARFSEVRLTAPLAPNINHRSTVFGGSAAAVAILAGWALLHVRIGHGGHGARIVIQRSSIEYVHPIDGDFQAVALAPDAAAWERFSRTLDRRGRGRVDLLVEIWQDGVRAGQLSGTYVVLPLVGDSTDTGAAGKALNALR
jgi:thioesterase domain-containing protein